MCLLCIEFNAGRMSKYDVRMALIEMSGVIPPDHREYLLSVTDPALDDLEELE